MHRSIFVSNIFRDMHLERDAIHTRVIPGLNADAAKCGIPYLHATFTRGLIQPGRRAYELSKKEL